MPNLTIRPCKLKFRPRAPAGSLRGAASAMAVISDVEGERAASLPATTCGETLHAASCLGVCGLDSPRNQILTDSFLREFVCQGYARSEHSCGLQRFCRAD